MADVVVNIIVTVATALASPIHRKVKYLFCANKVVDDLEDARKALTEERDNMKTRIEQAEKKTEIIEKAVEKWLTDVENLLREVDDLVQRTKTDINCFQGWFPMRGRYLFCKQMVKKIKAMGKFIGTSKDIQPFSHLAPLRGIPIASEDFIYFASTQKAYDELFDALKDDSIHMIGLYGAGGCGKTTLAREVGKKAEEKDMFDMVISITVSQRPNISGILGKIADMLNFKLEEETVEGRTERLWRRLEQEKDDRILIIVDDLWSQFNMTDIGICHVNRHTWKILVVTHNERICTLMDCQKMIHLRHLTEDESWTLFRKLAKIDDKHNRLLDGVPRKICDECKGVLIAIKTMASSLKGTHHTEWKSTLAKLVDSKAFDDHEEGERNALNCIKLSYDCLQNTDDEVVFLMCCMFPQDYHIPIEDLTRYALVVLNKYSFQILRSLVEGCINRLLESSMLMRGSVKMHNMVRDAALWIANRSDNCKILVNVDKPLSTVAEDNRIKDCFAVSSWWFNENPSFCELHAPNLKMLLVNISAHSSLNSLDLSPLTFEEMQGLQVFSLTINYKIVPISFHPSIQLLSNVRTLRLNGLKLGDTYFIASLTKLEVLDLRRCYFNELPIEIGNLESLKLLDLSECHFLEKSYNLAIGKCSQLEELYASKCYPHKYVDEIIMDIFILQNLRRFVLGDPIIPESTRVLQVNDFDISKLRTSNKNILQIAETISLKGLHGGCKNIIPDMVGVVGDMNSLSSLHLKDCEEIECIFDDLIPGLTELCYGPPLQVLHFFEKLEVLDIDHCWKLNIRFPRQCNLRNLKILSLSNCKTDEVLFSESIAQSLQQLEQLTIHGCSELKHIISPSGSQDGGCSTSEEIVPAPMNSHFLMTNIKDVNIYGCQRLESIFPLCYVEGVPRLQKMHISLAPNLKYVFGKCDHEHLSSYQNQNHVMLPHLEVLKLFYLDNLIEMCPESYKANWPSQSLRILTIEFCQKMVIPWFHLNAGYHQSQHHPNEIWSLECLQSLTLGDCEELKCLFSMEIHRSLPELMYLCIYNCQELEQIVAENEELPNAELYFPKLKQLEVENCNKLKSVFPFFMVTMLPQLISLRLLKATQLQEVFRHGEGDNIVNKMEIVLPNLKEVTLADLPNFEDIFHGSKLHAIEHLQFNIYNCPKIAPGLTKFQDETDGESEDSSSISTDVEDYTYFGSSRKAYNETLNYDSIHMIGSGKTKIQEGKMAKKENFYLRGPSYLASVNWDDANHRKSVAASLVNGVYVLEKDRQKQRKGPESQAFPWWDFFHFQLLNILIDDVDGSIFGAIYEFKPRPSMCNSTLHGSPRYVIAFRGTAIKPESVLRDLKLDKKFLRHGLHRTSRLKIAIETVSNMVASVGGNGSKIWLAGHSLGSCIALHAGKTMAKSGIFIESFLFNSPFPSATSGKAKHGTQFFGSMLRAAGLNIAMNSDKKRSSNDSFAALSSWIPYLFVNPSDYLCSEYIGYFKHQMKMKEIGVGSIGKIATQNSLGSLMRSDVHLIPSAILTVNLTPPHDYIKAHGIDQWWKPDLHLESKLYKYKYY